MRSARLACLALLASGCSPRLLVDEIDGLRHLYTRLNSRDSGTAKIKVPVEAGEDALLATFAVEPPNRVHVRRLVDPQGKEVFQAFEWTSSPYSKTNAGFIADAVSLNWPVDATDAPLEPGRWEVELGVVDGAQDYTSQPVFVDVLLKRDPSFDQGELVVSIVFTGGLDADPGLRDAVDLAKEQWRGLYATLGITLSFDSYAYPADDLAPPALGEEPAYEAIAQETVTRGVNLVISPEIAGFPEIFGIAGDIPGPLMPTSRSAVQISATLASGKDGEFSAEDVRLLAETMAHETAHFLGLFHPVEVGWDAWDTLDDTPECAGEGPCEDVLGTNLMFPYPICGALSCVPQTGLTPGQAGVTNRYVGTR